VNIQHEVTGNNAVFMRSLDRTNFRWDDEANNLFNDWL